MKKKRKKKQKKIRAEKLIYEAIWSNAAWTVKRGCLKRPVGRPGKIDALFSVIGEKLPFEVLSAVQKSMHSHQMPEAGIYIAHDSMGAPRYIGRGNIFSRLKVCKRVHTLELIYFSFYVVEAKMHEREIETLLIRGAANTLEFNSRKKRVGVKPGNIRDYEPGTQFYERQYKKGKKKKKRS